MRKAVITNKSALESSGSIQLTFDIRLDDKLIFGYKTVSGEPDIVVELVTKELQRIKEAYEQAQLIEMPLEITL